MTFIFSKTNMYMHSKKLTLDVDVSATSIFEG